MRLTITTLLVIAAVSLLAYSLIDHREISQPAAADGDVIKTEKAAVRIHRIATGLAHPWGLAFLPDGRLLVTEREGQLRLVGENGLDPKPIGGLPDIAVQGQGGLLDVALHPDFANNQLVYVSYAGEDEEGFGTDVARGRLNGHQLEDVEILFRLQPRSFTGYHFGSRLVFDRDGYLYITLGDRGDRPRAQDLGDHAGSVIRLHDDGRIPADNPFVNQAGARPEIFSYGNRNVQGAALHPDTGELWAHEHGPQGGDELNIIRAGNNYGWPDITYGRNYGIGTRIGEGTEREDVTPPLHYWVPSIAPSGMSFYTGERFPEWKGNILIGSLKFRQLARLEMDGEKVVHEERLLNKALGRIRAVRQGPDDDIYVLIDSNDGAVYRLSPAGN